jgi:hypothetical protein
MLRRDRRDTPTQGALEYVAQELHTQAFADLGAAEQQIVRDDAEERYYSTPSPPKRNATWQPQGGSAERFHHPVTTVTPRTANRLYISDKYSKTAVAKTTQSEGLLIQGGGRGGSGGRRW